MPNFKAKKLFELDLPKTFDDVSFGFCTKEQNGKTLIYTTVKDKSFFIEINKKSNEFVVKIDKLTKITNLALMQKALDVFKNNFCDDITVQAFKFDENKKLSNNIISSVNEFISLVKDKENVFLEIGFGSGRHLLYQAKKNPENTYIGIEIHKPSLIQVSKLAKDLNNVLLLDFDARIAIKELADNSLNGVYLHFPVPWDDAPHRRVVSSDFYNDLSRVLKVNGFFELRSDSYEYALYTKNIFKDTDYDFFKNKDAKIVSKYEDRWLKMNKNIYDFISYKKENITNLKEKSNEKDVSFIIDFSKIQLLKFVGDDYFVKITKIFEINDGFLLSLAYGGFDTPSVSYLECKKNTRFKFLFFDFCPTVHNIKAFSKLKELLE